MSKPCENCLGVGLVSTGAVPHDLSAGNKVTCSFCKGTGQVSDGASESAPEVSPEVVADPKVEAPSSEGATGNESAEPSEIAPESTPESEV